MTKDQLKDEMNYRVSINIVKRLLNQGIISEQEYAEIDTKLNKKYRSLLADICG